MGWDANCAVVVRQPSRGVACLQFGVGLGDVERMTIEELKKCVPHAVGQPSDGGHRPEALVLQVIGNGDASGLHAAALRHRLAATQ